MIKCLVIGAVCWLIFQGIHKGIDYLESEVDKIERENLERFNNKYD